MTGSSFLQLLVVGVLSFLSTNTDNLIIYTGFLSAKSGRKIGLVISYCISMSILLGVLYVLSKYLSKIPAEDVKFLGLILAGFGIFIFARSHFLNVATAGTASVRTRGAIFILGATMLMDSFDTMSVFVPLFADTPGAGDMVLGSAFMGCVLVYGIGGLYISRFRLFSFLARHQDKVIPIIMILVGIYIFIDTPGDVE